MTIKYAAALLTNKYWLNESAKMPQSKKSTSDL